LKSIIHILLLIILILYGQSCTFNSTDKQIPIAQKGVLNLRSWDLDKNGVINLDGEWEFFWQKFLISDSIPTQAQKYNRHFIKVPSVWNHHTLDGEKLSGNGYATYRLRILLNGDYPDLSIKLLSFGTAYELYANGKLIVSNGKIGKSAKDMKPFALPLVCTFPIYSDELELVIQVSNYYDQHGGFWNSIQLGNSRQIQIYRDRLVAVDLLLAGCFLIMAIYHLGIYFLRRSDTSAFYFSLGCILFGLRTLITDERYLLHLFPFISWETNLRLEYITFYSGFSLYIMFFHSLYREEFSRKLTALIRITFLGLIIFALFTPPLLFSQSLVYVQTLMLVIGVYVLYTLILAILHAREAAKIFFLGYLVFFAAITNDILFDAQIVETGYFASYGLLVFILCQSFALSVRYAQSLSHIEDLKDNLEIKVEQRTAEISLQNQALEKQKAEITKQASVIEKKNQNTMASINYASRIQQAILGSAEAITSNFEDSFIYLRPRDIVSGDFYWYTEVKRSGSTLLGAEHKTLFFKVIVAADCTGHGIPGAFMTVLGNTLLDEIINENRVTNPGKILSLLDRKLLMKLQKHNVNDGMDMTMLIFDDENGKVSFSGANNPLYFVRNNEIQEIKGSKFPIGSTQYKEKKKFDSHTIDSQPGDVFYIFSDGFQDQFGGPQGMKYYKKRFRELLLSINQLPMKEQKEILEKELLAWMGEEEPQTDDVLVIGIRV
jgi:serine phosphatase RsbU (regulator of sigma subunit)